MKTLNQYISEKLVINKHLKHEDVYKKMKDIILLCKDKDQIDNIGDDLNNEVSLFDTKIKLHWWKPWNGSYFYGLIEELIPLFILTISNNTQFHFQFCDELDVDFWKNQSMAIDELFKHIGITANEFRNVKNDMIVEFNAEHVSTGYKVEFANISEKLVINKNFSSNVNNYKPQTKNELKELIKQHIKEYGNEVDLNNIDISNITDMSELFEGSDFNGNISEWDVSKVWNMTSMFEMSKFDGDISNWDVSNVEYMTSMFSHSNFNQDISGWDVGNVAYMEYMFSGATSFDQEIGHWNVSNVTTMQGMFRDATNFNADISYWDVSNVEDMSGMFSGATSFDQNLLSWKPRKARLNNADMFHNCPQDDDFKPKFY